MMRINLIISREELYDEYFRIRCCQNDIYWMGHLSAPDYDRLKECYLSRTESSRFSEVGDKRIYLIEQEEDKGTTIIGQILMSINEDGIEIGISIDDRYQGMGIGTASINMAVSEAKNYSDSIYVRIRDDNIPSQKAFQKNGFIKTEDYIRQDYPHVGSVNLRKYVLV